MSQHFRINRLAAVLALAAVFSTFAIAQEKTVSGKNANANSRPAGEPIAVARGRAVYHDRCEICHFSDSDVKKVGPGLKGIFKRGKFANGGKVDDASMEKWVINGGKDMPPFKQVLSGNQIQDLISYLKTL
jgi:mono/diheme cytochrome c family protein